MTPEEFEHLIDRFFTLAGKLVLIAELAVLPGDASPADYEAELQVEMDQVEFLLGTTDLWGRPPER